MNEHAVAEGQRLTGGNLVLPALLAVAGKLFDAERIRREQTVRAGVPIRGSAQVVRVVEDGDADLLIGHASVIVDPFGPLAPDALLSAGAVRIHHAARGGVQRLDDA